MKFMLEHNDPLISSNLKVLRVAKSFIEVLKQVSAKIGIYYL